MNINSNCPLSNPNQLNFMLPIVFYIAFCPFYPMVALHFCLLCLMVTIQFFPWQMPTLHISLWSHLLLGFMHMNKPQNCNKKKMFQSIKFSKPTTYYSYVGVIFNCQVPSTLTFLLTKCIHPALNLHNHQLPTPSPQTNTTILYVFFNFNQFHL